MGMDNQNRRYIVNGPKTEQHILLLAHGAGAPMDSSWMNDLCEKLTQQNIQTARFEFPYMQNRRADGKKRPPDRAPVLLETWEAVIEELGRENLIIGGKSMGGQIASMAAAERDANGSPVAGCIILGYPFHAPGKPATVRAEHLAGLKTSSLILQGSRDPFGTRDKIAGYALSDAIKVHYLEDGEHSFIPRKASGRTQDENWEEAIAEMVGFISSIE